MCSEVLEESGRKQELPTGATRLAILRAAPFGRFQSGQRFVLRH